MRLRRPVYERKKIRVIMRVCVGARAQQEVGRNGRDYMWVCVRIKRKRYRESESVTVCNRKRGKKKKKENGFVCACACECACERVCAHWVSLINLSNRRNRKKYSRYFLKCNYYSNPAKQNGIIRNRIFFLMLFIVIPLSVFLVSVATRKPLVHQQKYEKRFNKHPR